MRKRSQVILDSQKKEQGKDTIIKACDVDRQAKNIKTDKFSINRRFKLATFAKIGEAPSEYTIRVGSVRMENHPGYQAIVQEFRNAGFEIKFSNEACLQILEVVDKVTGERRIEKTLYVIENMRYTDLEHELGHLKQFQRFGSDFPPVDRVEQLANGQLMKAKDQSGIITRAYNAVMEYHNFTVEFLRLYSRGANSELLKEHAQYVNYWRKEARKKGLAIESSSLSKWTNQYFPDIYSLENQYNNIGGLQYEEGSYPRGYGS